MNEPTIEWMTKQRDQLKAELDELNPRLNKAEASLVAARELNELLSQQLASAQKELEKATATLSEERSTNATTIAALREDVEFARKHIRAMEAKVKAVEAKGEPVSSVQEV